MINKDIDLVRAFYYALFSKFLTFTQNKNRFKGLKESLEILQQTPINEESKNAIENLLKNYNEKDIEEEFDSIFYDIANDPIPTTASSYDEERENGKQRVKMAEIVLSSNFRKKEDFTDTEDDIGFIFPFMQNLILSKIEGDEKAAWLEEKTFKIINKFIDEFIENLYMHSSSNIYKKVAILLKSFIETERIYFNLQAPIKEKIKKVEINIVADEEAKNRKKKKKNSQKTTCNLEEGGDVEDEV
ncbi:TorD/DmsD family molecular chaperone [Caminibacter mediatlanticus]|uniref:Molecular chaperone TorD family protein n=1 Tax=Caminibacter mediatlanticus TB-2 TaxID=391592 RepID=A0AAI9AJB2_9BACT|nr:molecular chaperone TorD family protein [Caminibacter mediatlanticus]EDM24547.1 hypothetical protein CMTB2_03488 [Caminibacter mediatlanticus TB-2]